MKVFPTPVGVFLHHLQGGGRLFRLPHARGGVFGEYGNAVPAYVLPDKLSFGPMLGWLHWIIQISNLPATCSKDINLYGYLPYIIAGG